MKVMQLLDRDQSNVNTSFKHRLNPSKQITQQAGRMTIAETIKLHWRLLPKFEVYLVLLCRDALRYFLVVLMLSCLFSTVTD